MSDQPKPTEQRANSAELSSLCQSCGLCCDGSLFGRVDLETQEIEGARKHRLRVVPSGKSFEQPCSAFAGAARRPGDRRGCTIYEERPLSCRRFVCRLYEKYRRDGGSIEEPLSMVRRARSLLASLGLPSLGVPALEDTPRTIGPPERDAADHRDAADAAQARAELTRILEESFARA
jgi:Fe-S-cluster containining protein